MNEPMVEKIVQAVLYEGYNLYPYRPSVKSRCRWTFGGIYPRGYSETAVGTDAWSMQVQCLAQASRSRVGHPGNGQCDLEVRLRFLHLTQRTIGVLRVECDELPAGRDLAYEPVESLLLGGTRYQSWQEAVEREVTLGPLGLDSLVSCPHIQSFTFPAGHALEPLRSHGGRITAVIVRDRESVEGAAEVSTERLEESVYRVTVRVFNRTSLEGAAACSRDEALMRTLVAMHAVLIVDEGEFFSLTDPPEVLRTATDACQNLGAWPVLVGASGEHDAMLASPIILYDYPQIAPESPGDLFDGTEIDEILTLRIMTLSDEEKAIAGAIDDHTRRLMQRTESLAREQLAGLHGAVRSLEAVASEAASRDGEVLAARSAIKSLRIDDVEMRPGDQVLLRPGVGGDILDLALNGKVATIESIEQDYEDHFHLAVTLDDDPGRDLGRDRQPGHRFFFKPEEVSPFVNPGARP